MDQETNNSVRHGSQLPHDPMILLSFINTQLRDNYDSLEELCAVLDADPAQIKQTLAQIDYTYDQNCNRFV